MKKFVGLVMLMVLAFVCNTTVAAAEDHGFSIKYDCGLADDFAEEFADCIHLFHAYGMDYEDGFEEYYLDIGDEFQVYMTTSDECTVFYQVNRQSDRNHPIVSRVFTEEEYEADDTYGEAMRQLVMNDIKACVELNERWA